MVETRQSSELDDRMRSTDKLLEHEQHYGGLLEVDRPQSIHASHKVRVGSPAEED